MTSTILALDGKAVPLKNITISPSMQFKEKDQSGQSSSTDKAEQGIKAKELRVSGIVPFSRIDDLRIIFELASATGSGGALHVYRVGNVLARAIKFRECTFSGQIDASRASGLQAWQVSFTLREKTSVPERRQARADKKAAAGTKTQQQAGGTKPAEETPETLSWFEENVLKPVDGILGGGSDEASKKA
ncbi:MULTISPECIES: baseplate complex protein [Lelliottia]|uniref:Uncharacterized protein n=1 Tax=Lelliottia amnigena TaxID=61646 RepID=A0AAP2AI17_LELAM|nr:MULTISPECIES: hypothetical protein [Lelliottia]MBL5884866.1 hypothetical protein [Lelliottia aquatilis]MBL5901715.1 hypothetical protein [Lelliottia amnigena]MBL5937233.1 hypothetical protein [Lelliottia amnigena]